MTVIMWLIFIGFVSFSLFNNFKNANQAKLILSKNSEVTAKITDSIQILEDGEYTDYSVDLEIPVNGQTQSLNLEIPEKIFEANYNGAKELKIIYSSPEEYNLRSYYERKANMLSNWFSILMGYIIVFGILFIVRRYALKVMCGSSGK